jgi:hypothetical protein
MPGAKPDTPDIKAAPAKRSWTRHGNKEEPPKEESKSTISSWFSGKKP